MLQFCGFISHLIGRETINIPEIFSGVHSFTGKTVSFMINQTKVLILDYMYVQITLEEIHVYAYTRCSFSLPPFTEKCT